MAGGSRRLRLALTVAGTLGLLATISAHDRITTKITWDRDIAPIVQARCVSCHREGGRAPMPLGTYAEARPWARAIKAQTLTRRMPKWHAARGYGEFANDPSLSPFEIALIAAWVDGGSPEKPATPSQAAGPGASRYAARSGIPVPSHPSTETLACSSEPLPAGRLVAVRPILEKGSSAGLSIRRPDGTRDVVVWVRDYDPEFPETYWLRTPVTLVPGSRLETEARGACRIEATFDR